MADPNLLSHRFYLADLDRSMRPGRRRWRGARGGGLRAKGTVVRRLIAVLRPALRRPV